MTGVALVRNPNSTRNLRSASGAPDPVPAAVRLIDCRTFHELSGGLSGAPPAGDGALALPLGAPEAEGGFGGGPGAG